LVTHSTHTPAAVSQTICCWAHAASFVHAAPQVWNGEHVCGAWQSVATRQSTHVCVVVSQTPPCVQSAVDAHSTQIPMLHTPIVQSAALAHAEVHVWEPRSHVGVGAAQSVLLAHSTQRPFIASQTPCMQSAFEVHPEQTPFLQNGVAPPHWVSAVQAVTPPLELDVVLPLLLPMPELVLLAVEPLLAVVAPPPEPEAPLG
jgi:hypothetical protein